MDNKEGGWSYKEILIIKEILRKLLVESGEIEKLKKLDVEVGYESSSYSKRKVELEEEFIRLFKSHTPKLKTWKNNEEDLESLFLLYIEEWDYGKSMK